MKILHITKKYPNIMAGDSIVVAGLEKIQREMGNQVFILTSNCDEIIKSPTITKFGLKIDALYLDRINLNRIMSLLILFFYSFIYLKKINPDIVHSHSSDLGFIMSFACRSYNIPIINTCHGITFTDKNYSFIKRKIEEFFLKFAGFSKIITVDKNSINDVRKLKINNVGYLPNGVNLNQFKNKKHKRNNKVIFLFIGRIEKDKGLEYLIKAVNKLKESNKNFQVWLVGIGLDQNYFRKLVIRLNLTEYIIFWGKKKTKEVIDYYYKADVFILPSLHEGFPLTILEAWAAELPVVTTNVGGISGVCVNKKNSLIIPPKNFKEITKAMLTLIENKSMNKNIGKNGRKLVEEKYGWEKIAKRIDAIYKDVI
jgi:glycosyltransferase involved in cell wall biosynthesis